MEQNKAVLTKSPAPQTGQRSSLQRRFAKYRHPDLANMLKNRTQSILAKPILRKPPAVP
jgi:hypothetical protein